MNSMICVEINKNKYEQNINSMICDECEETVPIVHCQSCGQYLCQECDKKIHNKGKRIEHKRDEIPIPKQVSENEEEKNFFSNIEEDNIDIKKYSTTVENSDFSPSHINKERYPEMNQEIIQSVSFLQETNQEIIQSVSFFDISMNQSQNIQQKHQQMNKKISKSFSNTINNISINVSTKIIEIPYTQEFIKPLDYFEQQLQNYLIQKAKQGEIIIKVDEILYKNLQFTQEDIQKLNDLNPEFFTKTVTNFGQQFNLIQISLRLKELSIQSIQWVLNSIYQDQMTPSEKLIFTRIKQCFHLKFNHQYWNGIIQYLHSLTDCNGDIILNQKDNLFNMKIIQIQQDRHHIIYIKDLIGQWQHNDRGVLEIADKQLWETYIDFLKQFFVNADLENDSRQKWNSMGNLYVQTNKQILLVQSNQINKAIRGGKFGAIQLIGYFGPTILRNCSPGKLSLLIQESINHGILVYYKTLLIKTSNLDFDKAKNIFSQILKTQIAEQENIGDQQEKLDIVKKVILDILQAKENGIPLSQLPKMIQKNIKFKFNLTDLGFPKLKNLLLSIDNILIKNDGQVYAILKENLENNINNKKQYSSMKQENQNKIEFNIKTRACSNLEAYNNRIQAILYQLIQSHPYGIQGEKLYFLLNQKLQSQFEFQLFDCQSFNAYLSLFTDQFTDIVLKKNNFIIFPKNLQRFNQKQSVSQKTTPLNQSPINFENDSFTPQVETTRQFQIKKYFCTTYQHWKIGRCVCHICLQQMCFNPKPNPNPNPNLNPNLIPNPNLFSFNISNLSSQNINPISYHNRTCSQNEIMGNLNFIDDILCHSKKKNQSGSLPRGCMFQNIFTFGSGSQQNYDKKYNALYINEIPETQEEQLNKSADYNNIIQPFQSQHDKKLMRNKTSNFA